MVQVFVSFVRLIIYKEIIRILHECEVLIEKICHQVHSLASALNFTVYIVKTSGSQCISGK